MYKKCFLIAPSGYVKQINIDLARKRLKELGFEKIIYKSNILSKYLSYAGDSVRRSNEINQAYSSDTDIISSIIGGQGAVHLLLNLDYDLIKKSKKIIIGFSDITILLNTIYQKTKTRCIHGPNLGKENEIDKLSLDILNKVINKENYQVSFLDKDILRKGVTKGKIVGGNIELLGRSLGTPYEVDTDDKIIFIEDYGIKSWRIFDILWQLKLAGKFDNIKGVILGHFVDCGENIGDYLLEFFKDFKCPVILNQPIGHKEPNFSIPLGEICIIDTIEKFWEIQFN